MVRFATAADIPAILAIYAPYVKNTAISFEYSIPTLAEFSARFQQITEQFPWLVWEEDGKISGYAYAAAPFERAAFGWCAEPSIYLLPQAQGKGIGRKLYEALEKLLKIQGYRTLYAIVTTDNTPSIAFHKALGYRHLADFPNCGFKLDRWHGITWLEKPLFSVDFPTDSPKPISKIVKSDQNLQDFLDKITLT